MQNENNICYAKSKFDPFSDIILIVMGTGEGDSLYSLSDFGKSRGTSTGTSATATAASRKLSSSGSSDTNQSGVKAPLSSQTSVDTTSTSEYIN